MQLRFTLPEAWSVERVRPLFEVLASALLGKPVSLACVRRQEESDANGAQHTCFTAEWADGEVTLSERVRSGTGNPRDGYGYDIDLVLKLPTLELKSRGGGWEPSLTQLTLEFAGSAKDWLLLRKTLRAALGDERDQSLEPVVVRAVIDALTKDGDVKTALELAHECLAKVAPATYGRETLIAWLAEHDPSAGGAAMRVKEAPAAIEGWLAFEQEGGAVTEAFARLSPFDARRWNAAGLPPAPWFAHPHWPLERGPGEGVWKTVHVPAHQVQNLSWTSSEALTGWKPGTDWQDLHGEQLPRGVEWRCLLRRRAKYAEGEALPRVQVTIECERRPPGEWDLPWQELLAKPVAETQRWTFIGGPKTGDVLLIIERSIGQRPTGVAFTATGSTDFIARAEQTITAVTRLPWHPTSAAHSVEPWRDP